MADPRFGEEEARELWRRAVELQHEAERESGRGRALTPGTHEGLSLEQVSAAAESAGIGRDYLVLALAEQRLPDSQEIDRRDWKTRWLRRLVTEVDALEASRLIQRSPEQVLEAFRRVASTGPFEMVQEESFGEDLLRDGVLVYRPAGSWASSGSFHSDLELADVKVLLVIVRPEGEADGPGGARIRVRAPLFRRGVNLALAGGFTGGLGAGGSYGGAAAGGAIAGLLGTTSAALVAGPAVLGALLGGAAGLAGFRSAHRWGRRKGEMALERLVKAVELEAES